MQKTSLMKVTSISTDRNLFDQDSNVFDRLLDYSKKMEELHVVVFTLKRERHKSLKVNNLYIYPTDSLSRWFYVIDTLRLSNEVINNNNFKKGQSVITTQDPFQTGFVGVRLSKKFNFPLQIQVHTDFLDKYFKTSFFNIVRRIIASFVIPRAQGLRVVSQNISDSIIRNYPNLKIVPEVLPIFVDIEKILKYNVSTVPLFSQFKSVILMASRLSPEKKIDQAISLFKRIIAKFPDIGLVIVGSGPLRKNLEQQVQKFGLLKNVVFVGWQNDLTPFYNQADIFLLTSEYEGYGMTLVEAGVVGLPIVTTNVGLAKTNLFKNSENSFVCRVGDVDCLSKAIINLIENPEKRKLFKERMQDSIKSVAISREQYVSNYVTLLESLLKR